MEITKVEIVPCDKGRLRAYVNITVDHCLLISDLKLIRSKKGYLVAMPAKRRSDGRYYDIVYPITTEMRKMGGSCTTARAIPTCSVVPPHTWTRFSKALRRLISL